VHFIRRAVPVPDRLGILAGSFNPPTLAHTALIEAAAGHVDEVLCVVPRVFPHKLYHGASLDDRVQMLNAIEPEGVRYSIAIADRGLFIDIARECHEAYGPATDLAFLCGRDAAERIVEWDYGEPGAIDCMLEEFRLLVAARQGPYEPPTRLAHRVASLRLAEELGEVSSTEVRERIRKGEPWEHLVPPSIRPVAERFYR
jgi:nicotinate (nicotinamide) nucleotide adenylyltransferase